MEQENLEVPVHNIGQAGADQKVKPGKTFVFMAKEEVMA